MSVQDRAWTSGMGHWEWGIGNGALGIGHWALGIGHQASDTERSRSVSFFLLPSSFFLLPSFFFLLSSSFSQTFPMRSSGQNLTTARPMMFCFGKNPQRLESLLLLRLSPMTKY